MKSGNRRKFWIGPIIAFCCSIGTGHAQTFDVISYKLPKGYRQQRQGQTLQFTKEDKTSNTYCVMMLYRSVDAGGNSLDNFNVAWETLVKKTFSVTEAPVMEDVVRDGNWEIQNGHASIDVNGGKAIAMLIAASGYQKLTNLLILTNSGLYEKDIAKFVSGLRLKALANNNTTSIWQAGSNANTAAGSVRLNTTTWDDGWISQAKEDWAEISKGNITVLVHYPNTVADAYNADKTAGDHAAWSTLVAPRYRNITNFMNRGIQGSPSITFLTADATDRQSGKKVHIVFYKQHYDQGNGRYLEVIADNKTTFEREFGNNYINSSSWEYMEQTKSWNKLAGMQWRNKFSVSEQQLIGKWTSAEYASLSYYFVRSGRYAGSTATSISNEFNFSAGNDYTSQHSGASGQVGNLKFSTQKYSGKYNADAWTIRLTNRFNNEDETFHCHFEAVKGGVILALTDANQTTNHYIKPRN